MAKKISLNGYDEFIKYLDDLPNQNDINILFSSDWCPDCIIAQPVIDKYLETLPADTKLLYVNIGDRSTWNDKKNRFRTDKRTHLTVIPTLLKWKHPQRLEMEQCSDSNLLDLFFHDDE